MGQVRGPTPCLSFLGFELDSLQEEIRIPDKKLDDIRREVQGWIGRKSCRKKDLESLVGRLGHACRVVKPGKTFMRRLFETLSGVRRPHHHIRLGSEVRSDILWWCTFTADWNGISIIPHPRSPSSIVWSDASGSFGCGAICPTLLRWLQLPWEGWKEVSNSRVDSITWMELLPIVLACALWGPAWRGQRVIVNCDNTRAVAVVNLGHSKAPLIMHLLRCLFFIRARYQFSLHVVYIEGSNNTWADAISRDYPILIGFQVFKSTYQRTPLPEELISLLMGEQPDWTSDHWIKLFRSSLQQVEPQLH